MGNQMRKVISLLSTLALTVTFGLLSTSSALASNSYNTNKIFNGNSCNSAGARGASAGNVTNYWFNVWYGYNPYC